MVGASKRRAMVTVHGGREETAAGRECSYGKQVDDGYGRRGRLTVGETQCLGEKRVVVGREEE